MIDKSELVALFSAVLPGMRELFARVADPRFWNVDSNVWSANHEGELTMWTTLNSAVNSALEPLRYRVITNEVDKAEYGWVLRAIIKAMRLPQVERHWRALPSVYGYTPTEVLTEVRAGRAFDGTDSYYFLDWNDSHEVMLAMYPGQTVEILGEMDRIYGRVYDESTKELPSVVPFSAVARTFKPDVNAMHALNAMYAVWNPTPGETPASMEYLLAKSDTYAPRGINRSHFMELFMRQPGRLWRKQVLYRHLYPYVDIDLDGGMNGAEATTA